MRLSINIIVSSLILLSIYSCTSNHETTNDIDVTNELETEDTINQASILIFSEDGSVIEEINYDIEEEDEDSDYYLYPKYLNDIKGFPEVDTIIGDFNGDGKTEKAWFKERSTEAYYACREAADEDSCRGILQFSDKSIPELVIEYCPFALFKNEGDLNDNGKDEIGILPGWFRSSCRSYHVYTLSKNKWIEVCEPISLTLNMREAGIVPIKKDIHNPGYAIIRESVDRYISNNKDYKIPQEYVLGTSCQYSHVVQRSIPMKK